MNLKLEDLSQYIVLIIFVLIIIKVLGDGLIGTIYELFTGKKKENEFDIDSMISRKKSQLEISPTETSPIQQQGLRARVQTLSLPDEDQLLDILKSLEWGDINTKYAQESVTLLTDITKVRGLPKIVKFFFLQELENKSENLLKSWIHIYDKSILWVNLINSSTCLSDKKALVSFQNTKINEVSKLTDQMLGQSLNGLLEPSIIEKITFSNKNFLEVPLAEIFVQYKEKTNLFKSLEPIVPINKESSNKWAQEVLGLVYGEHTEEQVKKKYKEITSKIHPDKFSSLNLNDDQVSVLNSNLAIVNKAYSILKR